MMRNSLVLQFSEVGEVMSQSIAKKNSIILPKDKKHKELQQIWSGIPVTQTKR